MSTDTRGFGDTVRSDDGTADDGPTRVTEQSGPHRTEADRFRERVRNAPGFKPRSGMSLGRLLRLLIGRSGDEG